MDMSSCQSTSILYQNVIKTVTLLDLPLSISNVQGRSERYLLSRNPPAQPYQSTEPKSDAARANVLKRLKPTDNEQYYKNMIKEGIEQVKKEYRGDWYLPRDKSSFVSPQYKRKRTVDVSDPSPSQEHGQNEPNVEFRYTHRQKSPLWLATNAGSNCIQDYTDASHRLVSNPSPQSATLHMESNNARYKIPPHAAFFLSSIDEKSALIWSEAALKHFPTPTASAGPGQFDFILLDPPWDSRSVRRSKKYSTVRSEDPMPVLIEALGKHIAPNGWVACWITNNESSRETAMASFNAWGVELMEEWAWLKVTSIGDPVYNVDGLWRKPYEVLLIGKMIGYEEIGPQQESTLRDKNIVRRLIVAVPDLHSRKPCLKELIEELILNTREYRALEIFARNLVEGWWSWGNEALKFNWDGYWSSASREV